MPIISILDEERTAFNKIKFMGTTDYIELLAKLNVKMKALDKLLKGLKKKKLIDIKKAIYYNEFKISAIGTTADIINRSPRASPRQRTNQRRREATNTRQQRQRLDQTTFIEFPQNFRLKFIKITFTQPMDTDSINSTKRKIENLGAITTRDSGRYGLIGESGAGVNISENTFRQLMNWFQHHFQNLIESINIEFKYTSRINANRSLTGVRETTRDNTGSPQMQLIHILSSRYPINLKFAGVKIKSDNNLPPSRLRQLIDIIQRHTGVITTLTEESSGEDIIEGNETISHSRATRSESEFLNFIAVLESSYSTNDIHYVNFKYWSDEENRRVLRTYTATPDSPRSIYTVLKDHFTLSGQDRRATIIQTNSTQSQSNISNLFRDDTNAGIIIYFYEETTGTQINRDSIASEIRRIALTPNFNRNNEGNYIQELIITRGSINRVQIISLIIILARMNQYIREIYCRISSPIGSKTFRTSDAAAPSSPLDKFKYWVNNDNWDNRANLVKRKKRKKK